MSDPYTQEIRQLAKESAKRLEIPIKEGVYYYMAGPSYETASEVKAISILGANVVGMSTVPEVIVASHGGMNVLGLSCITNMATGILDQPIDHEEVIKTGEMVKEKFIALLKSIISQWARL
jgi:purine-nucleoside phosphorylase